MNILQTELKNASNAEAESPPHLSSSETSPRLPGTAQDPETSSMRSFASRLRNSNQKLYRSISKTSTNVEHQLRLSQPAYTINNYEDSAMYLPRSTSYDNALSEIDDNFEQNILLGSPSPVLCASSSGDGDGHGDENQGDNSNILDVTADRLCATIHGYHLFCSTPYCWDERYTLTQIGPFGALKNLSIPPQILHFLF